MIAVNVCLVCALGLFFSSRIRSVNQALLWTYGTIAAYYFGPYFFLSIARGGLEALFIISPLAVLQMVGSTKGFSPQDAYMLPVTIFFEPIQSIPVVVIHVIATVLLVAILLRLTQTQLNQSR